MVKSIQGSSHRLFSVFFRTQFMVFLLIGSSTGYQDWYVGKDGRNTTDCGYTMSDPCLTISNLLTRIKNTTGYDTIYMIATEHVHEHCMTEPIKARVSIFGIGGMARLGCSYSEDMEPGIVLMFKGASEWLHYPPVNIQNIIFTHGFITGFFAAIRIENCYFMNGSLHLGSLKPFKTVDNMNCYCGYYSTQNNEWLTVYNTTWQFTIQKSYLSLEFYTVCMAISVCAFNSYINMSYSDLSNRRVYVIGRNNVKCHLTRNLFHGNPNNETTVGGVNIYLGGNNDEIIIEKCIFMNLIPHNLALKAIYDAQIDSCCALNIESNLRNLNIINDNIRIHSDILVRDCRFVGNIGAVHTRLYKATMVIDMCSFIDNHVLFGKGGAIDVRGHGLTNGGFGSLWEYIHIKNSVFTNNTSGMHMLLPVKASCVTVITTNGLLVASLGNGTLQVILGDPLFPKFYTVSGDGGALKLKNVRATIEDCVFVSNTALRYGGTIMTEGISLDIKNSTIIGNQILGNLQGTLIYSTANSHISDCQLISYYPGGIIVYNKGPQYIESVSFNCSRNYRFQEQGSIKDSNEHNTYTHLVYQCVACENSYSLSNGSMYVFNSTYMVKREISCITCPYGASCSGGEIRVKPYYWTSIQQGKLLTPSRCPPSYCCVRKFGETCALENICMSNRDGILCGGCQSGFSEAFFSEKCIENANCNGGWIIIMVVLCGFLYSIFLLFQNDLVSLIMNHSMQSPQSSKDATSGSDIKEGGEVVIILFYYFQDVSLISIPLYNPLPTSEVLVKLKSMLASLLEFRVELFTLTAGDVCVFQGLSAERKLLFKATFVPLLMVILLLLYVVGKCLCLYKKTIGLKMVNRAASALVLALMFSYQMLAVTTFSLLLCVPVGVDQVLSLNGNVTCYQPWQILLMIYASICLIPFFLVLLLAPGLLREGLVSHNEFFFACFLPLPVLIIWILRFGFQKHSPGIKSKLSVESEVIYSLLQDSYCPMQPIVSRPSLCWAGIVLAFRLILVVFKTFIVPPMARQLLMCVAVLFSLILQLTVKPHKGPQANLAEGFSCFALLVVANINLIRASFLQAEYSPEGFVKEVTDVLNIVEDIFLTWLPIAGLSVLIVFIIFSLSIAAINLFKKCIRYRTNVNEA